MLYFVLLTTHRCSAVRLSMSVEHVIAGIYGEQESLINLVLQQTTSVTRGPNDDGTSCERHKRQSRANSFSQFLQSLCVFSIATAADSHVAKTCLETIAHHAFQVISSWSLPQAEHTAAIKAKGGHIFHVLGPLCKCRHNQVGFVAFCGCGQLSEHGLGYLNGRWFQPYRPSYVWNSQSYHRISPKVNRNRQS